MSRNLESVFCLSLDFELILGYHDLSEEVYRRKMKEMDDIRRPIHELIEMLNMYDFTSTWAVVSHLFLEKCQGHKKYPDEGWLKRDPMADINSNPLWYARDIVEELLRNPLFEIGCHGFSHALFDEISEEQARYELLKSEQLAKELDSKLELKSFVFPRNRVGHRKLFPVFGYKAYRSYTPGLQSFTRFFDYLFPTGMREEHYVPKPLKPRVDEYGLVEIPSSMFLSNSGFLKLVSDLLPRNYFKWKIKKGIEKLVREGGVLHLFMHPHNYGRALPKEDFEYLIKLVVKHREKGEIQVLTMSEVADFYI